MQVVECLRKPEIEKAGVGGSITSLATIQPPACRDAIVEFVCNWPQLVIESSPIPTALLIHAKAPFRYLKVTVCDFANSRSEVIS